MTSPNPHWVPKTKIDSPVTEWVAVDPKTVEPQMMYKIIIGSVVPRPIAFVSTCSSDGQHNAAPYSFFNGISSNPACVVISVGVPQGGVDKKDTLKNILETGEFVVNSANEWMIEAVVHCAATYPHGVNELEEVGLTTVPSRVVKPLRVKESAVQLECKLYKSVEIGDGSPGSSTLLIGEIVMAHIYSEAYNNGRIDFTKIRNVARLGGFGYGLVNELFEIPVPQVEKAK